MTCATLVKFVVRFSAQLFQSLSPTWGLRHGDPLSLYLFLLVVEVLCMLLNEVCARGALQKFRLNRQASGISHLLFAYDSL